MLDLIVKELSKVLHIHFAFFRIYYSNEVVHYDPGILCHPLYGFDHVRELSYSGRLNDDTIRCIFLYNLFYFQSKRVFHYSIHP